MREEEPVYERLQPKECLIISKTKDDILVACNVDGKIELKRIPIPKS
jgi:hypothetical protein